MDECYSINAYEKTYEHIINPTNGLNNWSKSDKLELHAPEKVKLPEHPQGKRRSESGVKGYMNVEEVERINRVGLSQP